MTFAGRDPAQAAANARSAASSDGVAGATGEVLPGRDGECVRVQARANGRWQPILSVRVRAGAYRPAITQPGTYRAVFRGAAGPTVRIR